MEKSRLSYAATDVKSRFSRAIPIFSSSEVGTHVYSTGIGQQLFDGKHLRSIYDVADHASDSEYGHKTTHVPVTSSIDTISESVQRTWYFGARIRRSAVNALDLARGEVLA